MNEPQHYVITQRGSELSAFTAATDIARAHTQTLPRRVYRWGVDGPYLLAWGSDRRAPSTAAQVQAKLSWRDWLRREFLAADDMI